MRSGTGARGERCRDLAADKQRELDVEDRVGQLGQRLRAVLEHVHGDELGDRADRGAERIRRNLGDLGDVSASASMDVAQLRGEPVTRRTDVYAASVVLWETLVGQRLFRAGDEGATVTRVLMGEVEPPSRAILERPSGRRRRSAARDDVARHIRCRSAGPDQILQ